MWLRVALVLLVACGHRGGDGNQPGDGGVTGDGTMTGDGSAMTDGGNPLCSSCGAPPADVCEDGSHLKQYDSVAGCENNTCVYPSHVVDCANGCANGACQPDACSTTTCSAPPPTCNGSTLRTSAATCTNGTCMISYVDETCANGCSAGACLGPVCGGTTCNAPPSATCLDPKVLSGGAELGTCSGTCSYGTLQTLCSQGCFAGACDAGSTESIFLPAATWMSNLAFAVDAAGWPHVVGQISGGNVIWRHLDESGWHDVTIDTNLGSGVQVALALDPAGAPVVAYYEPVNKRLRYAEWRGTAFHLEEVSTASPAGQYPSIAIDASGVRWIASNDGTLGLRVAHGHAGSWTFESLGSYSGSTQLAFDPAGVLHLVWGAPVSYADPSGSYSQPAAYHAARIAGTWQIDTVSAHGIVFKRGLSFAVNGDALVAYGVVSAVGQNDELRMRRYGSIASDVLVESIGNWLDSGAIGIYDARADVKFIYASGAYTLVRGAGDFWSESAHDLPPNPYIWDATDGPDGRPRFLATLSSNSPANVSGYAFVTPPACVPSCSGAACGSDGCGGSCGTCAAGQSCGPDRACSPWAEETVNMPALTTYPAPQIALATSSAGAHHLLIEYQFPEHYYTSGSTQNELLYMTDANGPWELPSPQTVVGIPSGNYAETAIVASSMQVGPSGPEAIFEYGLAAQNWSVEHATPGAQPWAVDWSNSGGQATPRLLDIARNTAGVTYVITECGYYGDVACVDRREGGGHTTQTLTGDYAVAARMVVDSAGHVHILWTHMTSTNSTYKVALEYATDESGTLVSTPLGETASGSSDVFHPQIALAPDDTVHIAFVHAGTEVHHGVLAAGTFTFDTVPANAGGAFALAVDRGGVPAILATYGGVTLYRGPAWSSESIPSAGATESPSLAFDAANKPHVFFQDYATLSHQLRLAWKP